MHSVAVKGSTHCTCVIITLEIVAVSVDVFGTNNKTERLSPSEYDTFRTHIVLIKNHMAMGA